MGGILRKAHRTVLTPTGGGSAVASKQPPDLPKTTNKFSNIGRNEEVKRYILHIDDLEQFETFYNLINDKGLTPFDCWKAEFEGISKSQKEKFLTILS